jgi:hypothetical protein
LVSGAKVAVDDGGGAERPAPGVDRGGVVGGVHEFVEIRDAGAVMVIKGMAIPGLFNALY